MLFSEAMLGISSSLIFTESWLVSLRSVILSRLGVGVRGSSVSRRLITSLLGGVLNPADGVGGSVLSDGRKHSRLGCVEVNDWRVRNMGILLEDPGLLLGLSTAAVAPKRDEVRGVI